MEKRLKRLFDFQKFEQNEELNKVIEETESRFGKKLSCEELANVAGGKGNCDYNNRPRRHKW